MAADAEVKDTDGLWRGVFSERQAKRAPTFLGLAPAKRSTPPRDLANVFMEKSGERYLSVDRHDDTDEQTATAKGDQDARKRGVKQFYGWLRLEARDACRHGRKVVASPTCTNPGHADIILPEKAEHDSDERKQQAQELVSYSKWQPRHVE
ncbi:MAG: hypothetical protein OXG82_21260 [Gammaproteobacteria bacterium]|nr:hypothetical protein [Gammaproteobacteria bacterium]